MKRGSDPLEIQNNKKFSVYCFKKIDLKRCAIEILSDKDFLILKKIMFMQLSLKCIVL